MTEHQAQQQQQQSSAMLEGIELTAENVEAAVLQFYRSGATQVNCHSIFVMCLTLNSQETHKWLTLAQLSPQAWSFCWQLIASDKPHEVQFFGASCLAVKVSHTDNYCLWQAHLIRLTKVSRCWTELSSERYDELRKRLLELLTSYQVV